MSAKRNIEFDNFDRPIDASLFVPVILPDATV